MLGRCFTIAMAVVALLANACAPAGSSPTGAGSATDGAAAQPRAPKTLTIAQEFEPPDIEGFGSLVRLAGSGNLREVVHNHLVRKIRDGVVQPELAAELPSIENGTWRVNADGSMDVTWRLRPKVRWQDGTPFTSADLVFALDTPRSSGCARIMHDVVGRQEFLGRHGPLAPEPLYIAARDGFVLVCGHRLFASIPTVKHPRSNTRSLHEKLLVSGLRIGSEMNVCFALRIHSLNSTACRQ